jgi:glycosyltransferase involved in cell wall biosynthesis
MLTFLSIASLLGIFYAYFGYPILLKLFIRFRAYPRLVKLTKELPSSLTVVITARNEEKRIQAKIENTVRAARYCAGKSGKGVEILVASDCSDDRTDAIVRSLEGERVRLVRSPERKGKESAQRLAVSEAKGEIIVFTDAKVKLDEEALYNCVEHFADPATGAVSSIDLVEGGDGSGEGFYVRYEMWLRRLETEFSTIVGLSGSAFAVRRQIADAIRDDVPSDFALLLETVRRGRRGVLAENMVCRYEAVQSEEEEFGRKVRTILRGISALFICRYVLDFRRYRAFTWQVVSHKLFRWGVPFFLIIAFLSSLAGSPGSDLLAAIAAGMLLFFGGAGLAYVYPELRRFRLLKIPLYFTIANLAILRAWWDFVRGRRSVSWTPSEKGAA